MVSRGPRPAHRRKAVGRPYRTLQAWVYSRYTHCWLCHQIVDKTLPYRDPQTGRVNRASKSVDHVIPLLLRPDLALDKNNARLAHLRCNTSRGAGRRARRPALITSVRW